MGDLSDRDACLLWGRSGGCCNNPGCLRPLYKFATPRLVGNAGERAHIVGKQPDAARGDPDRSAKLAALLDNHILLCSQCHKLVDDNPAQFPESTLIEWKVEHEARVAALLNAGLQASSTIAVHVRARFGGGEGRVISATTQQMIEAALQSRRFFDDRTGLKIIDVDDARRDVDQGYWNNVQEVLQRRLQGTLATHGELALLPHLTVFASGPIPVLVSLGRLIGDTRDVDVRDFNRDTSSWLWPDLLAEAPAFRLHRTAESSTSELAMLVELSGRIDKTAVIACMGAKVPKIVIDVPEPLPGLIRSPADLIALKAVFRQAFEHAKGVCGDGGAIHAFGAMPLSAAVAFGQCQLPKAMPILHVYDNNVTAGGWRRALSFIRDVAPIEAQGRS